MEYYSFSKTTCHHHVIHIYLTVKKLNVIHIKIHFYKFWHSNCSIGLMQIVPGVTYLMVAIGSHKKGYDLFYLLNLDFQATSWKHSLVWANVMCFMLDTPHATVVTSCVPFRGSFPTFSQKSIIHRLCSRRCLELAARCKMQHRGEGYLFSQMSTAWFYVDRCFDRSNPINILSNTILSSSEQKF